MKTIKLKGKHAEGKAVLVSDCDFERVSQHSWCYKPSKLRKSKFGTVFMGQEDVTATIKGKQIRIHRFILDVADSKILVDHIDGNRLNNTRENLRFATRSQNSANKKGNQSSQKPYKGVCAKHHQWKSDKTKITIRWFAQIKTKGKTMHLGYFSTPEAAAKAYDVKAKELFGEFAKLNFPEEKI